MAKLEIVRASGALILSAILFGCASAPSQPQPATAKAQPAPVAAKRVSTVDRTPSWQKYQVSGSRIARRMDKSGKPISADFVQSTTSEGLQMMPGVTMVPCTASRKGC